MDKVQVLLSTYNGEKYIEEQVQSILKQEDVEISLLIRDDSSTDKTLEILEKLAKNNTNVTFYKGENLGPAKSFMDLVKHAGDFPYFAFADQDDVWNPKKLISAIRMLKQKENEPSLYVSALEIVDENLNSIGIEQVSGNFCFEGEMVKNIAAGCTQVFNKELCYIIKSYYPNYIVMHDSWITKVCYAIGGNVIIDSNTHIKYRQHSNNVFGYQNKGIKKLKKQFRIAFKEKVNIRVNMAKELKKGYEKILTKEAKQVVENLINYQTDIKAKIWLLRNKKFKCNNFKTDMEVKLAILLNKF